MFLGICVGNTREARISFLFTHFFVFICTCIYLSTLDTLHFRLQPVSFYFQWLYMVLVVVIMGQFRRGIQLGCSRDGMELGGQKDTMICCRLCRNWSYRSGNGI